MKILIKLAFVYKLQNITSLESERCVGVSPVQNMTRANRELEMEKHTNNLWIYNRKK